MKKLRRALSLLLAVCCALSLPTVCAAAETVSGAGLAVFEDVADMTPNTFSDVSASAWYYQGVETSYNKGILVGYGNGFFGPGDNITWAEAIKVAAVIHARYYANAIETEPKTGERWYAPYYRYCSRHGLLPEATTAYEDPARQIDRKNLAYLFAQVVDETELPSISDISIGDESEIDAYYLDSVKLMYSSGVMRGVNSDHVFLGDTTATRSELAQVIANLLLPAQRAGHDSRANADMADFEANLENDSVAVELGGVTYALYKNYETVDTVRYGLFCVDGSGNSTKLYSPAAGMYLSDISVYNGRVYFCMSATGTATGSLLCYDPSSGSIGTVYSGYIVESYCFYDGGLYALLFTQYADKPSGYLYAFGRISGGSFTAAASDLDYNTAANIVPYGWNGRIYFKLGELETAKGADGTETQYYCDKLYAYDISSGEIAKVCDYKINTSFFDGHVMYFLAYDNNGNYDKNLYAISVQAPSAVKTFGEFPAASASRNRSLYKFGDTFYCLSSFSRNLYSMDDTGATRLALICGGVYSSMCFTESKMVLIPNTLVTSNANELKVYNASSLSARSLYGDWLGQSVYYEGARFVPEDGKEYYSSDVSVSTVSALPITVTKAFARGNDFIIQAKYVNTLDDIHIKLRSYVVKVYLDGQLVAYDLNRMSGYELTDGDVQTFTFVIAGSDVLSSFEVGSGTLEIEIVPTFDQVPEDSGTT